MENKDLFSIKDLDDGIFLKPFDKIIGCREFPHSEWELDFYAQSNEVEIIGISDRGYDIVYKYQPWMAKYIGTDIPHEMWRKEDD